MNPDRLSVFLAASDPSSTAGSMDYWHKVLTSLNTYSAAITAVATVVLAIVTVVYVVLTRQLVKQAQRDRDTAYQPLLAWNIQKDGGAYKAQVVNNSPASAFQCILVALVNNASVLMRTDPFDLGHSNEDSIEMKSDGAAQPPGLDLSVARAICQNQFGHMFYYKQGTTDTLAWRPSARHWWHRKPAWITWYENVLKTFWTSKLI